MCGIAGFYCFGKKRPNKDKVTELFKTLEYRGKDASGFAYIKDRALIVYKDAKKSSELVKEEEWLRLELPKSMILHTRWKTQGHQSQNVNNHPLYNKDGLCIVHNGMIYNDKEIFEKNKRDGEVDSEAILHILSMSKKGDKIKKVFDKLEGSYAFACIDRLNPDNLILVRKDNPIELYYDSSMDILYFCSERDMMQKSFELKKHTKRGFNTGEGEFHHYSMDNNHCMIIDKDGVSSYRKYTPKRESYSRESKWGYGDDWYYGKKESKGSQTYDIECPWCLGLTRWDDEAKFHRCDSCNQLITEEDLYY